MEQAHDLPTGIAEWVASVGGGELDRLERHVARREAWVVDVRRPDGSVLEGFLRLDRDGREADVAVLRKEARIVAALGPSPVPVPTVHGWSDDLRAALYQRVPGRSDLDRVGDAGTQHAVMADFMRVLGEVHRLDLDGLALDDVLPPRPVTPADCALGELDLILGHYAPFLSSYCDPLLTFGIAWLRANVPASVERVSLVQGDTGPVNFLFDGERVSAVIDWEWGHFGDPMEDLGNICVREFWNPSGGLGGMFDLYASSSGIPYSRKAAQYYRVQQNMRGMVGIHAATTAGTRSRDPLAWMLVYRYVGDRATCEAIAESMGVELHRPELPELPDEGDDDLLADAARDALEHDVLPAVTTPFARARVQEVGLLVRCMDRRRRHGAALEAMERDELGALLGTRVATAGEGLAQLDAALRAGTIDQAAALGYLARRAYRDEWLHEPAVTALYPGRRWSPLD